MSCALPCTWWCCTIVPVWAPPRKLRTKSLSYVCFRLILQAKSFVLFWVVVFELLRCQVLIHTFPKWCSHISMGLLILLDHWGCHVNSFPNQFVSLSSGSDHFNICKINSKFSQRCLFHPSQVVFVSRPPILFFFKDSDFLIKVSFCWWEVSPFFCVNVLIWWFPGRC